MNEFDTKVKTSLLNAQMMENQVRLQACWNINFKIPNDFDK